MALALGALFVVLGYLIGAIPFGFLIARWFKGVDIRTQGSGNIGATNVGRVLGFRFFVLVFILDMVKGLMPTLAFPAACARLATPQPALGVFVALATILGHNFPIYLHFRGGKGVATSFGALIALDPVAMLSAGVSFVVFLLVTRIVSISSIMGGIVFAGVHFVRVDDPWSGDQRAMSVATIALLVLLIVRHRANLARFVAGTEPKVMFRKKRNSTPSGRIGVFVVLFLVVAGLAGGVAAWAAHTPELRFRSQRLETRARMATGHQRAERLAFADAGRLLAITCPRYNRVVLARVSDRALERDSEITLEGRPVAVWPTSDRLYILERPIADAHHVEAGWLEAYDIQGKRIGSRLRIGFDPDDLAILDGDQTALVLTSGNAEGETNRPNPALLVVDLAHRTGEQPTIRARLEFNQRGDDPERIAIAPGQKHAAVSLAGSGQVAWIDVSDLDHPRLTRRTPISDPGALAFTSQGALIVACKEDDRLWRIDSENSQTVSLPISGPCADVAVLGFDPEVVACALPRGSGIELIDTNAARSLGKLAIRGPANLADTRPQGLAVDAKNGRLAVANRQGGSVHLVSLSPVNGAGR
ncbi:MAG TPA: glycerol-3-phosphate 1-O-acyltransferase PlsY [Isosphaeraceae bacterium]|nr:glycerol-3-phosphate 1-O-acyltransferase PlsY [Isosphaeraceae bacterium]